MEPITTTVAVIAAIATCISVRQYAKIKNKNEEIDSLLTALTQYSSSYAFDKCDGPLIDECQKYLQTYFKGKSFAQILEGKSEEEKKQIAEKLVSDFAKIMKVDICEIKIEQLANGTLGEEKVDTNGNIRISIHSDLLTLDPDRAIFTILHELRHALQDSSLRDDKWGFSDERKAQWLIGNQQYVCGDSESKFRAYYYQILENDANAFAAAVLKKLK